MFCKQWCTFVSYPTLLLSHLVAMQYCCYSPHCYPTSLQLNIIAISPCCHPTPFQSIIIAIQPHFAIQLCRYPTSLLSNFIAGQPCCWSPLVTLGHPLVTIGHPWLPLVTLGYPCSPLVALGHPWCQINATKTSLLPGSTHVHHGVSKYRG